MSDLHDWLLIARDFGFPGLALFYIAVIVWKGGKWFGSEFLAKIRDRHLDFLDAMQQNMIKQTVNTVAIMELLRQHDEWERERMDVAERGDVQRLSARVSKLES